MKINENYKTLAQWIRKGLKESWRFNKDEVLIHHYVTLETPKYSIILYALKFALIGKEGDTRRGLAALRQFVGDKDPFTATPEFFGVDKDFFRRLHYVEGVFIQMSPEEIATRLESGTFYDLTDLERRYKELRDPRERLNLLVHRALGGVYV